MFRNKSHFFRPGLSDRDESLLFWNAGASLKESKVECRSYADGSIAAEAARTPSKDRITPPGLGCPSSLMIRSRRPGAGLQGVVDGRGRLAFSAFSLRKR